MLFLSGIQLRMRLCNAPAFLYCSGRAAVQILELELALEHSAFVYVAIRFLIAEDDGCVGGKERMIWIKSTLLLRLHPTATAFRHRSTNNEQMYARWRQGAVGGHYFRSAAIF